MNIILRTILLLCCFISSAFADPSFLVISDIHYGSDNKSGEDQDTGDEFLKITLDKMQELTKQVNFILVLGDLPTHMSFVTPKKEEYEKVVFHGLYEADKALKPMFYITGNNDSLFGNYQPFEVDGKSPLNFAQDWTGACVYCNGLIIDDTYMRSKGFYSSYVIPKNKNTVLIALNTTQWVKTPLLSRYPNQERDALEQFSWLEQQLKNNHAKQLIIAMHIPPGNTYTGATFWHEEYIQRFVNLLRKYHQVYQQISIFSSHSHMDEIRKINLKEQSNVYVYATPSISRNHHNNPGIKIFAFDNQWAIKNYTTYYTTSLNEWGNEHYQALGSAEAIFPECKNAILSQCLNSLSDEQVCNSLEKELFYGVKSPRVYKNVCIKTYKVN